MTRTVPIPVEVTVPEAGAVLEAQGIPAEGDRDPRMQQLLQGALAAYRREARPAGILVEISRERFQEVFQGEGRNHAESPVGPIGLRAEGLALYAVTLGEGICAEISRLFRGGDFAEGLMLDTAASEGTERAAGHLETLYRRKLVEEGRHDSRRGILRFSPGYCGWDVTGQRALFGALRPDGLGLSLNESCLMHPLKSISGVILAGKREIFEFEDAFPFCADCATRECRERLRGLREGEEEK